MKELKERVKYIRQWPENGRSAAAVAIKIDAQYTEQYMKGILRYRRVWEQCGES